MIYKWLGVLYSKDGRVFYTDAGISIWNLPIRANIAKIEFVLFEIGGDISWEKHEFFKPDSVYLQEYDKVVNAYEIAKKGRVLCTSNDPTLYDVNEVLNLVRRCENKGYYAPYVLRTGCNYKCFTMNPEIGGEIIG